MRRLAMLVAGLASVLHAEPPAAPIEVPFETLPSQHIVVSVKVNGKGPYRLIFDTGAPMLLVNTKLAKEANVTGGKKAGFAPFGAMPDQVLKKLELGPLIADDVPTVVMEHPTVRLISEAYGPIDGLIGFPFFARYRTSIDYQSKRMTFLPNGYQPTDMMKSLMTTLEGNTKKRQKPGPRVIAPAGQWGVQASKADGDETAGVDVVAVMPDGAAEAAGLRVGDRLLTVDGRWTDSVADLFEAASRCAVGRDVKVTVRRGGREVAMTLTARAGL